MTLIEELAKDQGFENLSEMFRMTAMVDLSTFEKLEAFKKWQYEDGSKAGLEKLIEGA